MKFQIRVDYHTGDSFNTYDDHEILDYDWESEEIASENARAIIEHYEAYACENGKWTAKSKKEIGDYAKKWWYVKPYGSENGYPEIDPSMNLKLSDGTLVPFRCPWCGYFESLTSVEVVIKAMKYYPN